MTVQAVALNDRANIFLVAVSDWPGACQVDGSSESLVARFLVV